MMALMSSPREQIAARVRAEVAAASLSGRGLAARLGVPPDGIVRRLRGYIPWRADELIEIAHVLGIDPCRFLDGVSVGREEPGQPPGREPAFVG